MSVSGSRVAIVTGGARGIGYEIALALARSGMRVALADWNGPGAEASAAQINRDGLQAMGVSGDVSSSSDVQAMVGAVVKRWDRIDVLVNNAGICPMTPFLEIGADEWDKVLAVNLKGAFLCSQAVVPWMRKQGAGKIINIASSAGQMGGIAVGMHYSASKAGTLGLTKSLARVLAPQIQVNAVSPGTTESEMTSEWDDAAIANIVRQIPAGRLGRPVDVAAAVEFLASERAGFITGQTINVNGGLYMV
jgi:3-oxoacyl-[acyl-carrier protein] reductase